MQVEVSWAALQVAAYAGLRRQLAAVQNGRKNTYGKPADEWGVHIEGACAEYAVAQALGVFWTPLSDEPLKLPGDVGRLQIRSTGYDTGHLRISKQDPADARFLLVINGAYTGSGRTYRLAGWTTQAASLEFWAETPRAGVWAYWIPQAALKPVQTLMDA